MKILISNDDGVHAPGLKALAQELASIAEVFVVAPDRDMSAAGKSLTLRHPLRAKVLENGFVSVEGTPTDCVHLALRGWLSDVPDMVVSGINSGPNLGDDVHYSGTVAAASEGRSLGFPSIAISLDFHEKETHPYFCSAAKVARHLVQELIKAPLPADTILNVNVPNLPFAEIKGIQVVRLGQRHPSESMIKDKDPRGVDVYWIGRPGLTQDAGPDTDFATVKNQYVSVSPLLIDLTRHQQLAEIAAWTANIKLKAIKA